MKSTTRSFQRTDLGLDTQRSPNAHLMLSCLMTFLLDSTWLQFPAWTNGKPSCYKYDMPQRVDKCTP